MFERFSDDARKAMDLARQAALDRNQGWIGTEHVLLGMVALEGCKAKAVLAELGASAAKITEEVDGTIARGDSEVKGQLPFTPRTMTALNLATEEAAHLAADRIDTTHLLLGLMAEKEGVAARVLHWLGVSEEQVRARIGAPATSRAAAPARPPGRLARWLTHWTFWPVYAAVLLAVLFAVRPWQTVSAADARGIKLHMADLERAANGMQLGSVLVASESAGSPGSGWLRCNGRQCKRAEWPELAEVLAGGTSGDSFTLPDYEGLSISGTPPPGMVWCLEAGKDQTTGVAQPKEHLRFWVKARR